MANGIIEKGVNVSTIGTNNQTVNNMLLQYYSIDSDMGGGMTIQMSSPHNSDHICLLVTKNLGLLQYLMYAQ